MTEHTVGRPGINFPMTRTYFKPTSLSRVICTLSIKTIVVSSCHTKWISENKKGWDNIVQTYLFKVRN